MGKGASEAITVGPASADSTEGTKSSNSRSRSAPSMSAADTVLRLLSFAMSAALHKSNSR